jgi:hypothetical protein
MCVKISRRFRENTDGNFSVSSLLANATGDPAFFEAASRSFTFLTTQLYNNVTGEVVDGFDAHSCGSSPPVVLVDPALFIEGAAIFGDVTENQTVKAL